MSSFEFQNFNNVFGKPTLYKNINIYPVKLTHAQEFYNSIQILLIPKNKFKEIEIIKMSYLRFLLVLIYQGHPNIMESLQSLLHLTLKAESIDFRENKSGKLILLVNDKYEITEKDFDKIKKIIFEQNLITVDDEILDEELERKIKEAREFLQKRNTKIANLEQQIVAYHCAFTMPYEEIEKLTIYQFHKGIERMTLIKTADVIQNAKFSGMVSFKDESNLPNWLSHIDEEFDKNSDVLMSKSEFNSMASKNGLISSQ